jgi:SulP family sulfate permease
VVASIGLFIYRSMKARVVELAKYKDGYLRDISLFAIKPNNLLSIFRFDGYLYFANCTAFENAILQALNEKKELKYLILDLEWMNDIDASGLEMIETLILRIEKLDIKIFFSGFRPKVIKKLVHTQAIKLIKDEYRFHTIDDAIDYIVKKYKKKIDVDDIESFTPEKNKEPDLAKKVLKEFKD